MLKSQGRARREEREERRLVTVSDPDDPRRTHCRSDHLDAAQTRSSFARRHPGAPPPPSAAHRGLSAARPPPLRCAHGSGPPRPTRESWSHGRPARSGCVLRRGSLQPAAPSHRARLGPAGCAVRPSRRAHASGSAVCRSHRAHTQPPRPVRPDVGQPSRGAGRSLAAARTPLRQSGRCAVSLVRCRQCRHPSPAAGVPARGPCPSATWPLPRPPPATALRAVRLRRSRSRPRPQRSPALRQAPASSSQASSTPPASSSSLASATPSHSTRSSQGPIAQWVM